METTNSGKCSGCGAVLPPMSPGGHCAQCLLQLGLACLDGGDRPGLGEAAAGEASPAEPVGARIGQYKLLEKLGEGGFGVVYTAEQEAPIRRKVALKIIKLGMDTRQVIARFEAERQALAMMDHPNIARVFEAGTTETGRPYFVMELVDGLKITDYCDGHKLSTRQRLDLFIEVCQAIQHAHQKGIIHRDIKPSNVLVTEHDGKAVPKVIDFGIAKATSGQSLTDKSLFTAFNQFVGTPGYVSPEQAGLGRLDVDALSDVYSLGVLLYELLTGQQPFKLDDLRHAAMEEMFRVVREQEPPRPSTRLTSLTAQELTTVARRRQSDPAKLAGLLRGDLDWIVMKALEKDRARRYETANSLAGDILRHLRDEPVVARPPSNAYRLQRLVRRNKLAFAAGTAVAGSLVAGLTLATVLLFRERAAKQEAKEQAAIAKAVNDFLQDDLLRQADSYSQADARFEPNPNLTVREALDRAAQQIPGRFKDRPRLEAAVRSSIGVAFRRLGQADLAVPHLQRALALRQTALGRDHPESLTAMNELAVAYREAGDLDRALPLLEEALKLTQARSRPDHADTLIAMYDLGLAYLEAGQLAKALPLLEETLKQMKAKLGPDHPNTLGAMNSLAEAYQAVGKPEAALPLFEETLRLTEAKLGPSHPNTLGAMNNLGWCYREAGKLDKALPLLEETLRLRQDKLGREHPDTLGTMGNLAVSYEGAGKLNQALPLFEEALKIKRAKLGTEHPRTLSAMDSLAGARQAAGNVDQALPLYEEALRLKKAKLGLDHPETLATMNNLARAYQATGKLDQAVAMFEETLKVKQTKLAPDHPDTISTMHNLAFAYREAGDLERGLPLLEQTLILAKTKLGADHPTTLAAMNNLAGGYQDAGQLDQAIPVFEQSLKLTKAKLGPEHPYTIMTMHNVANAYRQSGDLGQAIPLFEESLRLAKAKIGPEHPTSASIEYNLALAYQDACQFDDALALFAESLRVRRAKLGPDHPNALTSLDGLGSCLVRQNRFTDAEPILMGCFNARKEKTPDDWRTFEAQSHLGTAVLGEKKYREAELLLVQGYQGLKERETKIRAGNRTSVKEAGERVVELYEAWEKPDEAALWKVKLASISSAAANPLPK